MAVENVRAPVNGVEFKSSDSNSITNGSSLAETFDTFLTLLTTQLKNQDPLNPMETNEFTSQLVEFTGVEQAISTNKKLDDLIALQTDLQLNNAVGYIGKNVSADSIMLMLQGGESKITYDLGGNAAKVNILVIDEFGETVRTIDADTDVGHHEVVWDGLDDDGDPLADGLYGFLVTAADSDGKAVPLVQGTSGQVTGAKLVDGQVVLEIGELEVELTKVLAIEQ